VLGSLGHHLPVDSAPVASAVIHIPRARVRPRAHPLHTITILYIMERRKSMADNEFLRRSAKEPQWKCEGTAMEVRRNRNLNGKEPQRPKRGVGRNRKELSTI